MDLETLVKLYERIASFGFPFMLFLALVGSYFELWYWGKPVRAERAEHKAREAKLEAAIVEIKTEAADREAHQQGIIEKMMNQMLEAAGLLKESARRVSR